MNKSIEYSVVRSQMMKLWKEVFGDSDDYIALLFDHYFKMNRIEYYEESRRIVSSLLSIDYILGNKLSIVDSKLNTRYLCGLATDQDYRGQGIMTKLIDNAIKSAYNDNIAFVFLLPANDGLINYYHDRCFVSMSYNRNEYYFDNYNFTNRNIDTNNGSCYNILNLTAFIKERNCSCDSVLDKYYNDICYFINNWNYPDDKTVSIIRNRYDIDVIIRDNIISEGCICIAYDENNNMCGIVISQCNEFREVKVQMLLYINKTIKVLLLSKLQEYFGEDVRIAVSISSEEKDQERIFAPYRLVDLQSHDASKIISHEEVFASRATARTFAMARIIKVHEVLIFAAYQYPHRKYSILITQDFLPGNCGFYEVADGQCIFTPIGEIAEDRLRYLIGECEGNSNFYHLSVPELASLLWRKPDDPLLDDVISIPRLSIEVSLLLE